MEINALLSWLAFNSTHTDRLIPDVDDPTDQHGSLPSYHGHIGGRGLGAVTNTNINLTSSSILVAVAALNNDICLDREDCELWMDALRASLDTPALPAGWIPLWYAARIAGVAIIFRL